MNINDLLTGHSGVTLVLNTVNSDGTAWFCADGNRCNSGRDYRVLAESTADYDYTDVVTLGELYSQADLLEVQVDGVLLY